MMSRTIFSPLSFRWLKRAATCGLAGLLLAALSPRPSYAAGSLPRELAAVGTIGRTIVLVDTDTDEVYAQIATQGIAPREITPSADGRTLFVITKGRSLVEEIDIARKSVVDTIDLSSPRQTVRIFGLAVSPQGDTIYLNVLCVDRGSDELHAEAPQIWAFDLASRKATKLLDVPWGVYLLIASPVDGRFVYEFGRDLYVIDLQKRQITRTIRFGTSQVPGQGSVSVSCYPQFLQTNVLSCPTGRTDPITGRKFVGLLNLDLTTGSLDQMDLGPAVMWDSAVISPDHQRAYAVWNELYSIDLTQRKVVAIEHLPMTEGSVNISSDGGKLYLSDGGPSILIYAAKTLKVIKTVALPETTANCAIRIIHPR
jgi:DNA-binding beta-propeller fold protein YncE